MLITTIVMMIIGTNLALSLGMVGSLSIIRFRTAIKEPRDIAFLFWSISAGIVTGAGLLPLAVLGSLFIGIFLVLFAMACQLCGMRSFGVPYFAPVAPHRPHNPDLLLRLPVWLQTRLLFIARRGSWIRSEGEKK